MRLDKYLKVSRLIKRRTVANEACDAGKVLVNGKAARASYDVKQGDVLEITLGARSVKVKVTEVKEVVRKEDAAAMYTPVNWDKKGIGRVFFRTAAHIYQQSDCLEEYYVRNQ